MNACERGSFFELKADERGTFFCQNCMQNVGRQRLSLHMSQVAHQAGAHPGFSNMKRLGVFLLPTG